MVEYQGWPKEASSVADVEFEMSERSASMRNVLGLSAVLLVCVALSSCSGNRPEKAFMGMWKGTYEGETIELSLMEKDISIAKTGDETFAGTWTIDPEGNAVITFEGEDGRIIATLLNDGKIIARKEGESSAVVFEKSDSNRL
ncbi:MAG: hypothetical protein OEW48_00425 [Phycisphaerae bacterium]|nr:hypothetical protein [Phycisphaerae bacterium]